MRRTAAGKIAATTAAVALVVLAATAGSAYGAAETAMSAATAPGASQPMASFTGEYVDGAPVYRLPAISVTASRAAALAASGQEAGSVTAGKAPIAGPVAHVATAATVAPDRNVALDVAVAAFGTLVAIALSFGLAAGRRRRQHAVLPQPRQWVAAQPFVPATAAVVSAADSGTLASSVVRAPASPVPRAAVSLTELRAQEQRARRRAARRRGVETTQPDAA